MTEPRGYAFDHEIAIAHLKRTDKRLARVIERSIEFQFERKEAQSPYDALLEAITHQSISGKAAATIFARLKALGSNGEGPKPEELLGVRFQKLRKVGLSAAKIAAVRDLAKKTIEGIVPTMEQAQKMTDDELIERLVAVRGVGHWTVEMFLIFRLGRPDVLPIHDYGVQKGYALTYGMKRIPKPRELAEFAERWRPYRTVASWYLWRAVQLAGKDARKITRTTTKAWIAKRKLAKKRQRRDQRALSRTVRKSAARPQSRMAPSRRTDH